jgi:hypothetical protein
MRSKALTLILALSLAISAATLIEHADATDTEPGCCICFCGAQNATTSGAISGAVCTDVANIRECGLRCADIGCDGLKPDFAGNVTCSDPALAETCGGATMAPASSPTGLLALAVLLAGFGAFYLRRRSIGH